MFTPSSRPTSKPADNDQRPSSKEVQSGGYYVIQKNGENPSTTTTSAPCSLFSYNTDQQPKYSTAGQLSSTGHSQGNITVSAPMQKTYINVISKSSTFPDSNTFVDVGHFTPHTTISSGNQATFIQYPSALSLVSSAENSTAQTHDNALKNYAVRLISPSDLTTTNHALSQYSHDINYPSSSSEPSDILKPSRSRKGAGRGASNRARQTRVAPILQAGANIASQNIRPISAMMGNTQLKPSTLPPPIQGDNLFITVREHILDKQQTLPVQTTEKIKCENNMKNSNESLGLGSLQSPNDLVSYDARNYAIVRSNSDESSSLLLQSQTSVSADNGALLGNNSATVPTQMEAQQKKPIRPKAPPRRRNYQSSSRLKAAEFDELGVDQLSCMSENPVTNNRMINIDEALTSTIDSVASGGAGSLTLNSFTYRASHQPSAASSFSSSPRSQISHSSISTPTKKAPKRTARATKTSKKSNIRSDATNDSLLINQMDGKIADPLEQTLLAPPQNSQQSLCRIHVQNPPNMLAQNFPLTETKIQVVHQTRPVGVMETAQSKSYNMTSSLQPVKQEVNRTFASSPSFISLSPEKGGCLSVHQYPALSQIEPTEFNDDAERANMPLPVPSTSASKIRPKAKPSKKKKKWVDESAPAILQILQTNTSKTDIISPPNTTNAQPQQLVLADPLNKNQYFIMQPLPAGQVPSQITDPPTSSSACQVMLLSPEATRPSSSSAYRAQQQQQNRLHLMASKEAEFRKYAVKLYHLQRTIKALVYKNGALADELARLNQRIQTVTDERRTLAKRLQYHERNRIRRIQAQYKRANATARKIVAASNSQSLVEVECIAEKVSDDMPKQSIQSSNPSDAESKASARELKGPLVVQIVDQLSAERMGYPNSTSSAPTPTIKSPNSFTSTSSLTSPKPPIGSPMVGRYLRQSYNRTSTNSTTNDEHPSTSPTFDDSDYMVLRSRSSSSTEFGQGRFSATSGGVTPAPQNNSPASANVEKSKNSTARSIKHQPRHQDEKRRSDDQLVEKAAETYANDVKKRAENEGQPSCSEPPPKRRIVTRKVAAATAETPIIPAATTSSTQQQQQQNLLYSNSNSSKQRVVERGRANTMHSETRPKSWRKNECPIDDSTLIRFNKKESSPHITVKTRQDNPPVATMPSQRLTLIPSLNQPESAHDISRSNNNHAIDQAVHRQRQLLNLPVSRTEPVQHQGALSRPSPVISTRSHTLPSVVVQKGLSSSSNSSIHHGTAEYNEHQHRNHRQIPLNTARPSEGFINRNNQQHPVPSVANHSTYQHGVHGPVASTTASQSLTSSKRTGRATAVSLTQRR